MTFNFYAVFDSIANGLFTTFTAINDGMAVRDNLPQLSRVRPYQDLQLYQVGTIDSETMDVTLCPRRFVSWDAYKFPETKSSATIDGTNFNDAKSKILNK